MAGIWEKLSSRLIDTHCHIHHYSEPESLVSELKKSGMTVHCVTVKPSEFPRCQNLLGGCDKLIPSLGLFPMEVMSENILETFFNYFEQTRFIGEIGLDYSITDELELRTQKETFQTILDACHKSGDKVLSIHSRRSADDVMKMLGKSFNSTAIMHWFSGSETLVENAPDNIFFSLNTAMLKSRQGKKIIRTLRPEQVLTETDGPYVKIDNEPAYPGDIKNVINSLAAIWNKPIEDVLETIRLNYSRALTQNWS